ncbi:MAG: hypothetical protein PHG23_00075 [Candidatus Pacebacteria bacterium]|nr:hypothetical protein [Candidatus Paceibacterota bacterium]
MAAKKTLKQLRRQFPEFIYESYKWEIKKGDLKAHFYFKCGRYSFSPAVTIKSVPKTALKLDGKVISNFVFNLGLMEMLSYWKAFCSPKITVLAGGMDKSQIKWWEKTLISGMGQYFYENKINFKTKNFISITSEKQSEFKPARVALDKKSALVLVSGGKDSAVSLQITKEKKIKSTCLLLNPSPSAKKIAEVSGCREIIICERVISPKLLELNRQGFLNGHTPFVAYLSFLSVFVAALFNKKYVVFSNEKSSNEGNVIYLKEEINHQYSKTFEFENRFREYLDSYLASSIDCFSLMRPLYELQIARIFSKCPIYFPIFLSCNEAEKTYSGTAKKTGKWCESCAKCLFVYMAMYPFLKAGELKKIFATDLYANKNLLPLLLELIGEKNIKPLECVGTKKESLIALYLGWKKNALKGLGQPELLKYFEEKIMPKERNWEKESEKILGNWDNKNNLPKKFDFRKDI